MNLKEAMRVVEMNRGIDREPKPLDQIDFENLDDVIEIYLHIKKMVKGGRDPQEAFDIILHYAECAADKIYGIEKEIH